MIKGDKVIISDADYFHQQGVYLGYFWEELELPRPTATSSPYLVELKDGKRVTVGMIQKRS